MKKVKQSSSEPSFETPILPKRSLKKLLLISTIKCLHPTKPSLDIAKIRIQNPIFFRIKFNNFGWQPGVKEILKRNQKYFKKKIVKFCRFRTAPSLCIWNQADQTMLKNVLPIPRSVHIFTQSPAEFFHKVAQSRITTKALQKYLHLSKFINLPKKPRNSKQLKYINIPAFSDFRLYSDYQSEKQLPQTLNNIVGFFTHLQSLSLKLRIEFDLKAFYNIFETISDLTSLTSFTLKISLNQVDADGHNFEKTLAKKFDKLKYLHLHLSFGGDLKDSGKTLENLAFFQDLKYLNLEISSWFHFDHSDIIKFISAHENLKTLKLKVQHMRLEEYSRLFEGITKMESLSKLCMIQETGYRKNFDYAIIFKALESLKKLKSFKIHLKACCFDPNEMTAAPKLLFKHPSLEKVSILMRMELQPKASYQFDEEFYGNIMKLRKKLRSFKLVFDLLFRPEYEAAYDQVYKIIVPTGIQSKMYNCRKYV